MLNGKEVSLPEMLECRERRAYKQREYIQQYKCPVISFCMNIPGPVKTTPEIRLAFHDGKMQMINALAEAGYSILDSDEIHAVTGDEMIICVDCPKAAYLKDITSKIEETHPLGRLFDMDVIDIDGNKLSRSFFRKCLLCGRQAQECAASRRHSVEEMQEVISQMLSDFMR
ncbi:MAG: citrate lyase holo-[acyl-carrier protein] synthase [Lachnospiraceae bacterium]|nr:citrate lyase holo-[acyl-carrier protein] synthase [Lachnospiraceae bacterium]